VGLVILQRQRHFASDTLLGIMAHSTLSLGLVALSLIPAVRVDLMQFLFGDILAVSFFDLGWIYGGLGIVLLLLWRLWRPLLSITVQEDMARVEGVNVALVHLTFMLLIALVIALAMKVVGVLLVTSLMIIPAAAARNFARTPEQMAGFAALIGCVAVGLGLWLSLLYDTPAGPSIVSAAAGVFALTAALRLARRADLGGG
jgi:zinc transport system permease protein